MTPVERHRIGRHAVKRHGPHPAGLRVGLTLVACGLALGSASVVALANALYDMVP